MTLDEYEAALVRIEVLMNLDPKMGTPGAYELMDLVDRVEEYERIHYPMPEQDES